jgi:heat-inducible transcriptional repressor
MGGRPEAEKKQDRRSRSVLAAIIAEHLQTGEPVASRAIAEQFAHAAGWSSATIRNVMGELETDGLVEQPHTSAGRIPTDQGYRFYVNHLLGESTLSQTDREAIDRFLQTSLVEGARSAEWLLERAARALSALSENVGIVVSPAPAENRLKHIEFFKLADHRILVVLVYVPNLVQHKLIRFDEDLSQAELERTARYLNAEFGGKSLRAIRAELIELMRAEKILYDKLLRNAILLCEGSLALGEEETGEVYVGGASNMLGKPAFTDAERMRELFRAFEEKSRLIAILSACLEQEAGLTDDVHVTIGRENAMPFLQNCAVITAPYRFSPQDAQALGTLGVVAPVRVEYARMMALVAYTARLLEQLLWVESSDP